jgi:hypothetical protein
MASVFSLHSKRASASTQGQHRGTQSIALHALQRGRVVPAPHGAAAQRPGPRSSTAAGAAPQFNASAVILEDLYDLLEVPNAAAWPEIRAAYRKAASKTHPDVDPSPNASNRFKVRRPNLCRPS